MAKLILRISPFKIIKRVSAFLMILNGEINFKNFEFDQDKRWNSIAVLNSIGHENANDILEKEMDVDKSDRGQKKAAVAKASSLKNKKEFWDMFLFEASERKFKRVYRLIFKRYK